METGKDSVVIGNVPSNIRVGEGSVVIGATDANGNTIINQPMAVGRGAKAGKNSIAIGAFAGASHNEEMLSKIPSPTSGPAANITNNKQGWHDKPIGRIGIGVVIAVLAFLVIYFIKSHFGIQ
jgi:hypothetical protein